MLVRIRINMAKQSSQKNKRWPFILLFTVGFLIMIYPVISNMYYRVDQINEIGDFNAAVSRLNRDEVFRRIELARAYNSTLDPSKIADPYTDLEREGVAEYARMLEVKEKLGYVEIPKIDVNIPIYAGTSDEVLEKGIGHLEGTSLPIGGKSTHAVITGHRGLPKAKLFRNLNKLEVGDVFYIHNIETVLAYEVDQILTVEPHNFEPILVVEGEDYFTLLTCTPYMINSHRLLVRGHRIDYVPPVDEKDLNMFGLDLTYRDILMFLVPTVLIMIGVTVFNGVEMNKAMKRLKEDEEEKK